MCPPSRSLVSSMKRAMETFEMWSAGEESDEVIMAIGELSLVLHPAQDTPPPGLARGSGTLAVKEKTDSRCSMATRASTSSLLVTCNL